MQLVGKRSVASVLRWGLGLANIFVMIGGVGAGLALVITLFNPDFGSGLMDGLSGKPIDPGRAFGVPEGLTLLGGFLACAFTWWILNRLRRILLAVNVGDAFEPANVSRLRAVGAGLLGIQLTAMLLSFAAPIAIQEPASDYESSLGSWLGILIVFILAEVFRQGSAMRDDQQMTV